MLLSSWPRSLTLQQSEPRHRGALDDEDYHVREAAAPALATFDDERAVKPLLEHLNDEKPGVRYACALALGILGDEGFNRGALEALLDDESPMARKVAEEVAVSEIMKRRG